MATFPKQQLDTMTVSVARADATHIWSHSIVVETVENLKQNFVFISKINFALYSVNSELLQLPEITTIPNMKSV